MELGTEPEREQLLAGIGPAFSRLRRRTPRLGAPGTQRGKDLTRSVPLNAVADATDPLTIGTLGDVLGVDPSVASRMANDCIEAGLLERAVSQTDGRRTILQITEKGRRLTAQIAQEQRETFEEITAEWSEEDQVTLARLINRYADAAAAWQARQQR